jgi:tRNA(adenine34) deaminase
MKEIIKEFMSIALNEAINARDKDEVPIGAIVVKDNRIIGRGHNQVIASQSISSHAEINAINDASKTINNYRLKNCDIYVTLEPCHMCAKAIVDARIENLFFGALEPKTGAVVSVDNFLDSSHLNHKVSYSYDYLADESANLLRSFFESKRR